MIDRILDLNKIWILKLSVHRIWFEFWNELVRLDLDLKNLNSFISLLTRRKPMTLWNSFVDIFETLEVFPAGGSCLGPDERIRRSLRE